MWFPRLASDRVLRARPVDGPFALTLREANTERIHCLNPAAESAGLSRGMPLADARAYCPDLRAAPADPVADARFLALLRRWALRYCPWAGCEGGDGLVLDITGAAHLVGGEAALLADMRMRLDRAGVTLRLGLADTRGAAWALARHGAAQTAGPGETRAALAPLPVAALRIEAEVSVALQRLGLATIGALAQAPRAPLVRRFGPGLMRRLDQALGDQPEPIMPAPEPPHYATRLTLPEPIGRVEDVMAGLDRLLVPLCDKLRTEETGARVLCLTLRRVDQESRQVELRLARPMRDPHRLLPLFERGVAEVDAGFGIDQLRLQASGVEPLPTRQITTIRDRADRLDDLVTRIGTRIGLENIRRFLPADSHIPERAFLVAPAAFSTAESGWACPQPRPLHLFPPEAIAATGAAPPARFRWRRMDFTTGRATGPERIAPEWWLDDENWYRGLRDYWRVDTRQGRRLWMFYTPRDPGWFVQGEFA